MSGFFEAVGGFFGQVLGSVFNFIKDALLTVLDFVVDYVIEPIMNFLGFKDEDVYLTEIIAVKMFDEDLYTKTQLQLVTEYMKKKSKDALWYAKHFADTGDAQFSKYYRHGKWYFLDFLPDIQISCTSVNKTEIQNVLQNMYPNKQIYIDSISVMVPYDDDWCKWILQETYDYNVGEDSVKLNNVYYKFGKAEYDAGIYKVTLTAVKQLETTVSIQTVATIVGKATVAINTYDITEYKRIDANNVAITTYKRIEYVWNGNVIEVQETPHSITNIQDTETEDNSSKELVETSTNEFNIQRITITRITIISDAETNAILEEHSEVISTTDTVILEGEGTEYDTTELISSETTTTNWTDRIVDVEFHDNIRRYIVRYNVIEDNRTYLFIYNPMEGEYPALNTPVKLLLDLEGYPIAMLRNGFNDITNYNNSSQYDHPKPPTVSQKRYESTQELLSSIGMNVEDIIESYSQNPSIEDLQDCFFMYGVSPSDNHRIVSRVLYEIFDFIYNNVPPTIGSEDNYSASFKEEPYNAAIVWTPSDTIIKVEKIGSLGDCVHTVTSKTLTVKKQITPTITRTIILGSVATIGIIRNSYDGYAGGKSLAINDPNLVIPLPVEIVAKLTLMEKTALLGRSAYLTFYAYKHQHLEWYETAAFASFIKVISFGIVVVISVFSFGTLTGPAISAWGVLTAVLETALIAGALQLALHLINSWVDDPLLKTVFSVAAMAVAAYAGGIFDEGLNFLSATSLVGMAANAADIYTGAELQQDVNEFQEEYTSFNSLYEQISSTNEEIIKSLGTSLSTEAVVGLAVDATDNYTSGSMISPDMFYSMATTACYNYDLLYSGFYDSTVYEFCNQKLRLGLPSEEEE